jgi:hypothetical protein
MRKLIIAGLATAVLGSAGFLAVAAPAHAQDTDLSAALGRAQRAEPLASYAQYRGGRRYVGGPRYYGRGYYGGRGPYYGYYRRGYGGAAAAAGIAGLTTGAIVGGAIASQAAPTYAAPTYVAPGGDAVAYCAQRFRSYDPASGTYLGYDGLRHPCP